MTINTADIVFCIDTSSTMSACFASLPLHLMQFSKILQERGITSARYDCLLQQAMLTSDKMCFFQHESALCQDVMSSLYSSSTPESVFFTSDISLVSRKISSKTCKGNSAMLVALDSVMDFPWRPVNSCRRVVVLITDKPCEASIDKGRKYIPKTGLIARKMLARQISLIIIAPQSNAFSILSQYATCQYNVIGKTEDIASFDFNTIVPFITRQLQPSLQEPSDFSYRAIFGQNTWSVGKRQASTAAQSTPKLFYGLNPTAEQIQLCQLNKTFSEPQQSPPPIPQPLQSPPPLPRQK